MFYFISGMWCSYCARVVEVQARRVAGVSSAEVSFLSKTMVVQFSATADAWTEERLRASIERAGFGIRHQPRGWPGYSQLESREPIPLSLVLVSCSFALSAALVELLSYWGAWEPWFHYWLSVLAAAFSIPSILLSVGPFLVAGWRAFWSRHFNLDLFFGLGGMAAAAAGAAQLVQGQPSHFAQSGALILATLLVSRKLEGSVVAGNLAQRILFQIRQAPSVAQLKCGKLRSISTEQVRQGDRLCFSVGETIPCGGISLSRTAQVNRHLITGEDLVEEVLAGDPIRAGTIACSELKLAVCQPLGQRQIDDWVEKAVCHPPARHPFSAGLARLQGRLSGLALLASMVAVVTAESPNLQSGLVAMLAFAPWLLASVHPLAQQIAHLELSRRGILLSRAEALLDLTGIDRVFLDKTGTLEQVECLIEEVRAPTSEWLPLLAELAQHSQHPILQALRLPTQGEPRLERFEEVAGRGARAWFPGGKQLVVGESEFVLGVKTDDLRPQVAYNGQLVACLTPSHYANQRSIRFLQKLAGHFPSLEVLSGDPRPQAGEYLKLLVPQLQYTGGLSPEEKARKVGGRSLFIGDGLNDTLALSRATVSYRVGQRVNNFAQVDFQQTHSDLSAFFAVLDYARYYRRVLFQNLGLCALYYGGAIALTLGGQFSARSAALLMLAALLVILGNSSRLLTIRRAPLDSLTLVFIISCYDIVAL